MKTVRLLLAALSLATLTACGTETITGPVAPSARHDVLPGDPTEPEEPFIQSGGTTCDGTLVVTTDASGNTIVTCEAATTKGGGYMGSGG
jgi:hypothetical protein